MCRILVASRIGRDWKLNDQSVSNPWLSNVLRNMERTVHKWLYAVGPPVTLTGAKLPSNFQGAFRLERPFADWAERTARAFCSKVTDRWGGGWKVTGVESTTRLGSSNYKNSIIVRGDHNASGVRNKNWGAARTYWAERECSRISALELERLSAGKPPQLRVPVHNERDLTGRGDTCPGDA